MKGVSWLNVVSGIWLIIAPWFLIYGVGSAVLEDVVLGAAITAVAVWSLSDAAPAPVPGWMNLVLGTWVLIAPWVLAYAAIARRATTNDVIIGIAVIVFSAVQIAAARPTAVGGPPRA